MISVTKEETPQLLNLPWLSETHPCSLLITHGERLTAVLLSSRLVPLLAHSCQHKVICQGQDSCPLATTSGADDTCSKQVMLEPVKTQNPAAAEPNDFLDYTACQKNCPAPPWIILTVWTETLCFASLSCVDFCGRCFNGLFSREG